MLVARDTELSEILMRAFILRRLEMIRQGWGALAVLGSQHSARTLEIREFLSRNGQPYTYVDLDRDQTSQELLDRFEVKPTDVPVVICPGRGVLRSPSVRDLAGRGLSARRGPRCSVPHSHVALSEPEAERLRATCLAEDSGRGAMVYTALTLGLRSGEVRGLLWAAVDLGAGTLAVATAAHSSGRLGPTKGDGASDRDWQLPADLVDVLRHHQTRQKKASLRAQVWEQSGLCFTNEIGACIDPSNYRRELEALCTAAKVPRVTPTDLRRTFATRLRDGGARREDVAYGMGHTTTRMVDKHYYAPERRPITLLTTEEA